MKAALSGFFTIGFGVAIAALLVPDDEVRRPLWLFVFLALAICAWFCWAHPKGPKTPLGWFKYSAGAVGTGAILAVIDAAIFGVRSGHVVLDLAFSVLGGLVAVSGAVHSFFKCEQRSV